MSRGEDALELRKALQRDAAAILVVTVVFMAYQIYLTLNSFSALYNIALSTTERWQRTGSLWPLFQLTSESFGEVGLLLRLVDACLLVAVAWLLVRKQRVQVPILRKVILLEATYFLFYIPFVVYLLNRPSSGATGLEAGLSYALQIILVSPSLYIFYYKLKKSEQGADWTGIVKWFAIAFCLYFFAFWVKHFVFALYAVGIDFSESIATAGSVNSISTLLFAAVGALLVFLPVIRKKRLSFSWRGLGIVMVFAGVYFIVFDLISLVSSDYARWVGLTEWWAASLLGLGLVFAMRGKPK